MTGYIYKEFKQNRLFIILTAVLAMCVVFLPLVIAMISEGSITKQAFYSFGREGFTIKGILAVFGFISMNVMLGNVFKNDDKKVWGYFVASSPKGIKNFVFTKYAFVIAMSLIYLAVCSSCDLVFIFITNTLCGMGLPYMGKIFLVMFFIQLVASAVEIPFTIRFGEKKGSYIKMALMLGTIVAIILLFLLNPAGIAETISVFFITGEIPSFMKWALPVMAVIVFIISALISSKAYLKGVEESYK